MSPQEIFDTVVRHLLTQGRPAITPTGRCLYRGPDGTKCAIGCLIPDELYEPAMENRPVVELLERWPKVCDQVGLGRGTLELLEILQGVHDDYIIYPTSTSSGARWDARKVREGLREAALDFNLDTSVLDELEEDAR